MYILVFTITLVQSTLSLDQMSTLSELKLLHGKFWSPSLYPEVPCVHQSLQTVSLSPEKPWRFFSPNFPSASVPSKSECLWRFRIPYDANIGDVELTCDHFDVKGNFFNDCNNGGYLQMSDGDPEAGGDVKERLCGDLSSWVPIIATLPESNANSYVRNIFVKFYSGPTSGGTGISCRIVGRQRNMTAPTLPPTTPTTTLKPLVCPTPDPSFCQCGRVKDAGVNIFDEGHFISDRRKLAKVNGKFQGTSKRIIGGFETRPNQYPWHVGLTYKGYLYCGGSLVTKRHVVTAGHCTQALTDINYNPAEFRILLSEHDLTTNRDCAYNASVKKIWQHPQYNERAVFDYDFAVVELQNEIECSDYVSPICLPNSSDSPNTYEFRSSLVTGWGKINTTTGESAKKLQQVVVETMSNDYCIASSSYVQDEITDAMICAGTEGHDSCQGDSGGPLATLKDGRYVLAGVTSWGNGCGVEGYPGVYARLTSSLNWIRKIVAQDIKNIKRP